VRYTDQAHDLSVAQADSQYTKGDGTTTSGGSIQYAWRMCIVINSFDNVSARAATILCTHCSRPDFLRVNNFDKEAQQLGRSNNPEAAHSDGTKGLSGEHSALRQRVGKMSSLIFLCSATLLTRNLELQRWPIMTGHVSDSSVQAIRHQVSTV
jgi:hypothetical protein